MDDDVNHLTKYMYISRHTCIYNHALALADVSAFCKEHNSHTQSPCFVGLGIKWVVRCKQATLILIPNFLNVAKRADIAQHYCFVVTFNPVL